MTTATHFFLGANSGQGFQSLFQPFCAPERHRDLVILKGGPGTGKSTLMRTLGEAMEERGEAVEYFHCSGDPDSLDGVRFPRLRAAVVDGTAPHILEPRYPAAVDRVLDLGACIDLAAAKERREEILGLGGLCADAYQRAYRALAAARQLQDSLDILVGAEMDGDKLLRRTEGIIARELRGRGDGGGEELRFLGSLTCRGPIWRFDTAQALCPRLYQIQDSCHFAAPMLERIRLAAEARGFRRIVCPDPERPSRLHHLLLPELGLGFVTSREGMVYDGPAYRRVRVDAMVPADHYRAHKARIRFTRRMIGELREEAHTALREAKESHDALEAVYQPLVDFNRVEELTRVELERLLEQE